MVKGYQTDKQFKVNCPFCDEKEAEKQETDTPAEKPGTTCSYCQGTGEVTIEGQDKTPRTVTCGHCNGSGNEPFST